MDRTLLMTEMYPFCAVGLSNLMQHTVKKKGFENIIQTTKHYLKIKLPTQ